MTQTPKTFGLQTQCTYMLWLIAMHLYFVLFLADCKPNVKKTAFYFSLQFFSATTIGRKRNSSWPCIPFSVLALGLCILISCCKFTSTVPPREPDTLLLYCSSAPALVTSGRTQVVKYRCRSIFQFLFDLSIPSTGLVNNAILTQPNNDLKFI